MCARLALPHSTPARAQMCDVWTPPWMLAQTLGRILGQVIRHAPLQPACRRALLAHPAFNIWFMPDLYILVMVIWYFRPGGRRAYEGRITARYVKAMETAAALRKKLA